MRRAMLAAVLLAACTPTTTFIPTNSSPKALKARPVDQVSVFTTTAPERAYVEVGIVTAEAARGKYGAPINGTPELITALRQKAADQGCDGLVMSAGSTLAYQGTCIVYR